MFSTNDTRQAKPFLVVVAIVAAMLPALAGRSAAAEDLGKLSYVGAYAPSPSNSTVER